MMCVCLFVWVYNDVCGCIMMCVCLFVWMYNDVCVFVCVGV